MVNKTQFYKTKVALAVVVSLGLAACGGGDDSTATSNSNASTDATQNTVGNQTELTGTVQGVVVDSNANPIEGVKVYLGTEETVTNAGGQYVFTNVAVTNVSGVNNEGDEAIDGTTSTLVVTIGGSDTHLGALVTVTPKAQVNNTGGQGDSQNGGNSDVTAQTFIDGFTAEAGVAVLPSLNAGAYGYIRDCRTGAPFANVADVLSLDFGSVNADVSTSVGTNGVQLTNAEDNHAISSDADGMFSLSALAANSNYTLSAKKGWAITSGLGLANKTETSVTVADGVTSGGALPDVVTNNVVTTGGTTVSTQTTVSDDGTDTTTTVVVTTTTINSVGTGSEDSSEFLGTIEVCPVEFVDADVTVAPMIKSIDGQIGNTTVLDNSINYAALNQGVVNNFVINFTEEMAATFDLAEARVKVIAPGETDSLTASDATVTLSADGESATVTFVNDLAEGSKVDVWFPHWTAQDANDDLFLVDNTSINYDDIAVALTTTKAIYSHAYFCTFIMPGDGASLTLGPQVFDAETTEDGNSTDLSDYSTAFQDNYEEAAGSAITQLNDGDANSGARLVALADARGETVTIDQDYAVVEFDGTNAASIVWEHTTSSGTTIVVPGTTAGYTIVGTGADTELHIASATHNDVITATPKNGFDDVISTGVMSVTLVDAIAPTTVLQESYNITALDTDAVTVGNQSAPRVGEDVVGGDTANASFGNGGEISAPGTLATAAGEPIIHIQPRHLAGQTNNADDRNNELDSLTAGMSARLTATEITNLGGATTAHTAISTSVIANVGAEQFPIYDTTAYANWAAVPATIGVAFNEDVTLTTTAPTFDGSTTLSGYDELNNVIADVDGNVVAVDLVTFDTPSVVALSLDAGADLGFVGSVTDSRDNVSTENAQVFIQDTFPPMMTAGVWNGDTLTLTFNEAPVIHDGVVSSVTVINPSATGTAPQTIVLDDSVTGNTVIAGNVMTITLTSGENTLVASNFVAGANNEFAYDDDGDATNNLPLGEHHALINWDNVADATGNQWSEFTPAARGIEIAPANNDTRRWEVVAPRFLAVDAVGVFSYNVTTAGYNDDALFSGNAGDDDGVVTYTISFTHPIDLSATLNPFSAVIDANPAYDTVAERAGVISANTSTAAGVTMIDNLFSVDIDGAGAQATAFVSNVTSPDINNVNAAFNLSADHKVITLTVESAVDGAGSILHPTTQFGFKTTVTSAITGSITTSGTFNWQDNN